MAQLTTVVDTMNVPIRPKVPILRKLKTDVIRDLSSPENQAIANAINQQIDLMIAYKAIHSQILSLRSRLTNYRGIYKKYGAEALVIKTRYEANTSLGMVIICRVPSISTTIEICRTALDLMGITDLDELINNTSTVRQSVNINTDGLKLLPEVISQGAMLNESFINLFRTVEASTDEDRFICSSLAWMRDNISVYTSYLDAYRKARYLFLNNSRDGKFPRSYDYKGVVFRWIDIRSTVSLNERACLYFSLNDIEKFDIYKNTLMKVRSDRNDMRILFSLDDFDYDVLNEMDGFY